MERIFKTSVYNKAAGEYVAEYLFNSYTEAHEKREEIRHMLKADNSYSVRVDEFVNGTRVNFLSL